MISFTKNCDYEFEVFIVEILLNLNKFKTI